MVVLQKRTRKLEPLNPLRVCTPTPSHSFEINLLQQYDEQRYQMLCVLLVIPPSFPFQVSRAPDAEPQRNRRPPLQQYDEQRYQMLCVLLVIPLISLSGFSRTRRRAATKPATTAAAIR
ncbi:hypothetical protein OPV22_014787 [Ensete ventricosum]|uniref:Uncharacterized protein n=1 Tax=Ensete ventricosum TaxID=4639 RepID=A0AAV8RCN4_ENSVE|nr:hypothetical protein OPV22_014787 [Ensete ventricosum]